MTGDLPPECHSLFDEGWTLGGEEGFEVGGDVVWQVVCHRGEHVVVGRARTRAGAWRAAWRLAIDSAA